MPAVVLFALLCTLVAPAHAVEHKSFSSTPVVWPFTSPWGDLTDEPSGLGASRVNPGFVYWENEAVRNGRGMLYAVNAAGLQRSFSFALEGADRPTASMVDFEDMAMGPCNGPGSGNCIWVGDIGRVSADFPASAKKTFWLYRIAEPDIESTPDGELEVTGRFPFTVPAVVATEGKKKGGSTSSYDMEAMMVHPTTGEIFVVTKGANNGGLIRIMKYPGELAAGKPRQLTIVKTYQMPHSADWNPKTLRGRSNHLVTGGDIHPDGRRFILRTYTRIWELRGANWSAALASTSPVPLPRPSSSLEQQGEAVAYAHDGSRFFTLGEKSSKLTRNLVSFAGK